MPTFNAPFQYTLGSIRRNLDGEGFQLDVVAIPNDQIPKPVTSSPNWETAFERNFPMKTESIFSLDAPTSVLGPENKTDEKPSDGLNIETFTSAVDFEAESLTKCDFDTDGHLNTDFESEIHRFSTDFDSGNQLDMGLRDPVFESDDRVADGFDGQNLGPGYERDDHGLVSIDFESENHLVGNVTFDSENCFDSATAADFDEDHPFRTSHFDADFDNDI